MDITPTPQAPQATYPSLPRSRWLLLLIFISFTVDFLVLGAISLFYVSFGGLLNGAVIGSILISFFFFIVYNGLYLLGLALSIKAYSKRRQLNDYKALIFWQGTLLTLTLNEGVKILLSLNSLNGWIVMLYTAGIFIFGSTLALNLYKYRSVSVQQWRYALTLLLAGTLLLLAQVAQVQNISKWINTEDDSDVLEDLTTNQTLEKVGEFEALETANLHADIFEDKGYLYLTRYHSGSFDGGLDEAKTEEASADSFEIYKMDLENGVVTQLDLGDLSQVQVVKKGFASSASGPLVLVTGLTESGSSSYILALKESGVQTISENLNWASELIDAGGTDVWLTNVTDSSHADLVTPSLLRFNSETESFETGYEFASDFEFESYSHVFATQFEDKLILMSERNLYQVDLNLNEIRPIAESIYSPAYSKNRVFYSEKDNKNMNLYEYTPSTGETTLLLSVKSKSPCEVISNRELDYALVKESLEDDTNVIYQVNESGQLLETTLGETGKFNFRNTWILKNQFIALIDEIFYLYRFSEDGWERSTMNPKTSSFEAFPQEFSDSDKYGVHNIHFFENEEDLYVMRRESTVKAGKDPIKTYILKLNIDQMQFEKL